MFDLYLLALTWLEWTSMHYRIVSLEVAKLGVKWANRSTIRHRQQTPVQFQGAIWTNKTSCRFVNIDSLFVRRIIKRFCTSLRWLTQDINQSLDSRKTLHTSPSQASYGVSIVRMLKKIDCVITAPHCISSIRLGLQSGFAYVSFEQEQILSKQFSR